MILAAIGNLTVSCLLACTLPQGADQIERQPLSPAEEPAAPERTVWDDLAECESHGEWDYGPHSSWGSKMFHGGLQFHPDTWSAYRLPGYPEVAYAAVREQQIEVARRVLAEQGWGAWPDCSRKLGLR